MSLSTAQATPAGGTQTKPKSVGTNSTIYCKHTAYKKCALKTNWLFCRKRTAGCRRRGAGAALVDVPHRHRDRSGRTGSPASSLPSSSLHPWTRKKSEGTNSTIYCKHTAYKKCALKTNWLFCPKRTGGWLIRLSAPLAGCGFEAWFVCLIDRSAPPRRSERHPSSSEEGSSARGAYQCLRSAQSRRGRWVSGRAHR
jgi:hypothetical protein